MLKGSTFTVTSNLSFIEKQTIALIECSNLGNRPRLSSALKNSWGSQRTKPYLVAAQPEIYHMK